MESAAIELVDIGANLGHESFSHDLDAVLQRARAAGVVQLVVTGASREGSRAALALARAHPGFLYATAGVHPHHALEVTAEGEAELRELLQAPEVVANGECGLDYFRDFSPRDLQRRAFAWQLEIAKELTKPVFLHQRDAHEDFIAILKEHGVTRGAQFVIFRDRLIERNFLFELGEAVAVDVGPDSSTLQVTLSRDALVSGDYVAIRK